MKLYEIDQNIRAFWNKIMEQEGELTEEDIKQLDELEVAKNDKLKAYGVIIREMKADIDTCKAEKKRLEDMAKKLENRQEWLKSRLVEFMNNNEIDKFESPEVRISFLTSHTLHNGELEKVPEQFIKVEKKADITAIKDFIKNGGTIDGWYIEDNKNIQIK